MSVKVYTEHGFTLRESVDDEHIECRVDIIETVYDNPVECTRWMVCLDHKVNFRGHDVEIMSTPVERS